MIGAMDHREFTSIAMSHHRSESRTRIRPGRPIPPLTITGSREHGWAAAVTRYLRLTLEGCQAGSRYGPASLGNECRPTVKGVEADAVRNPGNSAIATEKPKAAMSSRGLILRALLLSNPRAVVKARRAAVRERCIRESAIQPAFSPSSPSPRAALAGGPLSVT